jgi:putative Mg2+ transporter-C (MgtC) family protein
MTDVDGVTQLWLSLRLAVGLLLGAGIGLVREFHHEPAGLRTHALVGLGAAIFTVASDVAFPGRDTDPSRIAANIVTGIGFIGAGAILREGFTVRGLSTAASLWAVGGIGLCAGAGLFVLAVAGAILAVVALEVFGQLERRLLWPRGVGAPAPRERED